MQTEINPPAQSKERVVIITSSLMSFITMPQGVAIVFSAIAASSIIVVDVASLNNQFTLMAIICASVLTVLYRWYIYLATDKVLYADLYKPQSETTFSQVRPILTAFQLIGRIVCGILFTLSAGYYLLYTLSSIYYSLGGTENIEQHYHWIVTLFSITLLFLQYRTSLKGKETSPKRTITIANLALISFFFFILWILLNSIEQDFSKLSETPFYSTSVKEIQKPNLFHFTDIVTVVITLLFIFSNEDILWQVHRDLEAPKKKNYFYTFLIVTTLTIIVFFIAGIVLSNFPPDYFYKNWRYATYLGILSTTSSSPIVIHLLCISFTLFIILVMLTGLNYTNRQAESQLVQLADSGYLPTHFKKEHPKFGTNFVILNFIFLFQIALSLAIYGNFQLLAYITSFAVGGGIVFTLLDFEYRIKQQSDSVAKISNVSDGSILPLRLSGYGLLLILTPLLIYVAFFEHPEAALIAFFLSSGIASLEVLSKRPIRRQKSPQVHEKPDYEITESKGFTQDLLQISARKPILVAARHPQGLHHLKKVLLENKSATSDVVVVTVRITREPTSTFPIQVFGRHEKTLFQEVFRVAQECGSTVYPIVVTGINSMEAIIGTALNLKAREIVLGMSGKVQINEQIEEFTSLWRKYLAMVEFPVKLRIITPRQDIVHDLEYRSF